MSTNGICQPIILTAADIARFHHMVDERGPDDCWPWLGAKWRGPDIENDYGQFHQRIQGKHVNRRAHRVAWFLVNGAIPKGLDALHVCDARICCNARHLFLGTYLDNTDDMMSKNRQAQGNRLPHAKLNPGKVIEIRRLRAAPPAERPSLAELAELFDVSTRAISKVELYQSWRSVA